MALKIIQANEVVKRDGIVALIAGLPGSGKTSLGCMTSKPILFDCDKIMAGQESMGSDRAEIGETPRVNVQKWEDMSDLDEGDLVNFDTVVIDTLGGSLNLLTEFIIRKNSRMATSDGSLQIKGWGLLKDSYVKFLGRLMGYGKNVILVAHAVEGKGSEEKSIRVDAVGGAKIEIFKVCDLMGLLSKSGKKYVVDFDQTEVFHGKNPARIEPGVIPDPRTNRDYMQQFLQTTLDKLNKHQADKAEAKSAVMDYRARLTEMSFEGLRMEMESVLASKDSVLKKIFSEVIASKGIGYCRKDGDLFFIDQYEAHLKTLIHDENMLNAEWNNIKESVRKRKQIFPKVVSSAGCVYDDKADKWLNPNAARQEEQAEELEDLGEEL